MPTRSAFLFDLDGTLVDSVYQHVLAWRQALEEAIELTRLAVRWAIATSGRLESAKPALDFLQHLDEVGVRTTFA